MIVDEARQLRTRHADLADALDRIDSDVGGGAVALAVTTTAAAYPTTAGAFYAVNPAEVDGAETEGATATFAADASRVFYALNLGTAVPPSGTYVIVAAAGGRWVFRFDG